MSQLHDPNYREAIKTRLRSLTPNTGRKWGSMSVGQMMWHLAEGLELCLGRRAVGGEKMGLPLPRPLMRLLVLHLPWPKGAPTFPSMKATGSHDLEAERSRCLKLLEEFAARSLDAAWPVHPVMGRLTGREYSHLQAKHFDHHLKQFGA